MAERILVRNEIDSQFTAARVEFFDFTACNWPPTVPDCAIITVGERVFGIELEFVDLKDCQSFDQMKQSFEIWNAASGNVQHDTAPGKIGKVPDHQTRQSPPIFMEQLPQSGECSPQARRLAVANID